MRITILEMPNLCTINLLCILNVLFHLSMGKKITHEFVKTVAPLKSQLDSYTIATITADSPMLCGVRCSALSNCKSFMFKKNDTEEGECFNTTMPNGYTGTQRTTRAGITCQSWSATSPHKPGNYQNKASMVNYCRDPGNDKYLWCYTMNPSIRYQLCDIHRCFMANNCRLVSKVLSSAFDRPGFEYYAMANEAPINWNLW